MKVPHTPDRPAWPHLPWWLAWNRKPYAGRSGVVVVNEQGR